MLCVSSCCTPRMPVSPLFTWGSGTTTHGSFRGSNNDALSDKSALPHTPIYRHCGYWVRWKQRHAARFRRLAYILIHSEQLVDRPCWLVRKRGHCWHDITPGVFWNTHQVCVRLDSIITQPWWIRLWRGASFWKTGFSTIWSWFEELGFSAREEELDLEKGRAVMWPNSTWLLTSITGTSCSHLSCFVINPRGLNDVLTHHVGWVC